MLSSWHLALLLSALPLTRGLAFQRRDSPPSGFVLTSQAPSDHPLSLRIELTPRDFPGLEKALYAVSTPGSPQYGKYLSQDEVRQFTRPAQASFDALTSWLSAHNLTNTRLSPAEGSLKLNVTAAQANELFKANYSVFTHQSTGRTVVRTLEYGLPDELQGHVDMVHPATTFPQYVARAPGKLRAKSTGGNVTSRSSDATVPDSCSTNMTPACLQGLYGIPTAPAATNASRIAVAGFEQQFANEADLQKFLQQFRPDISPNTTFTLQTTNGGTNPQNDPSLESDLDTQMTIGLAAGVPTTYISVGNQELQDPVGYLNLAQFLLNQTDPPQVLSVSYGGTELVTMGDVGNTICNAYAQLGARGVTVLFASGDGGVSGGQQDSSCTASDPFRAVFPASCPYLTAVGGTQNGNPEIAADLSSGGFSDFFPAPSYQTGSSYVSNYIASLNGTYEGRYNASGRAFPDIAAMSEFVPIIWEGRVFEQAGTSAATPIFASIVGLLNAELLAAGKSTLGFLNPFLYSEAGATAFNDITAGSNPGCGGDGFPATAGWDPVTGFGSPNYAKLKAAVGL
ncbi:family S53 protease [Dentipellis sp. KUC8613]|nr:family S53 protease [Dentipellis sp. KUC8613]